MSLMKYICKKAFEMYDFEKREPVRVNEGEELFCKKVCTGKDGKVYYFETRYGTEIALGESHVKWALRKCKEDFVPETLSWCRQHYVPKVDRYITCKEFGHIDGMDGSCLWCMEMTPYQWHMCSDESWLKSIMSPYAKNRMESREEAEEFIEQYKQKHPMGNERKGLMSDNDE